MYPSSPPEWIHSPPSTYNRYQEEVKKVLSELNSGEGVLTGQDWQLKPEQCSIVQER